MIYHVLPEMESFSAHKGGAIAHSVATFLRSDPSGVVVCLDADDTWGLKPENILIVPGLRAYAAIRGRRFLPLWVVRPILRQIYQPLLSRLKEGDIVWCNNRPFFAAALAGPVHSKGAKLIYQSHDVLDKYHYRTAFNSFMPDATIFVSDFFVVPA